MANLAFDSALQIFNELQNSLRVEGLEEIRLIKDKRTGMYSFGVLAWDPS